MSHHPERTARNVRPVNQPPSFEYDRTKGKFRSYLLGLINWRILDKLKADKRESELNAAYSEEEKSAAPVTEAAFIDQEWQNAAFDEALRRLQEEARPDHFAAFVESTVEGIDTETVMRLHGMSRDNIYQIRTRFTAKLKTFVETIRTEMDEGRFGFAKPSAPRGN